LAGTENEPRLAGRLITSVCATQVRSNANHPTRCGADCCSTSGPHRCARRSRKQAKQGANTHANGGSQGRVRFLGINLEIAEGVTVDHRGSVYSDFRCIVELPERVQTFVSFAFVIKDHSNVIAHRILLLLGLLG
jgi:hypothetical protein